MEIFMWCARSLGGGHPRPHRPPPPVGVVAVVAFSSLLRLCYISSAASIRARLRGFHYELVVARGRGRRSSQMFVEKHSFPLIAEKSEV